MEKHSLQDWCFENNRQDLLAEWNNEKNGDLGPADVSRGIRLNVWWKCTKGHDYQCPICERVQRNRGCPYCSGRKAIVGENDLLTLRPDLAKEWHPTKNGDLKPTDVKPMSGQKIWWQCEKGHEWKVSPGSRVFQKTGCPICSNKKVLVGYNDLSTTHPDIAKEWDFDKNTELKPTDITYGCQRKVWWKCRYGHEWFASPNTRTNQNTGCPLCSGKGSSLPEQGVSYYLESVCKIERRVKIANREVDIYLPDYLIGIEYDGRFYHPSSNVSKENAKDQELNRSGLKILRVKESDSNRIENNIIYFKSDNMHSNYEWALKQLCSMLAILTGDIQFDCVDIDVQRDLSRIRERMDLYDKENSLATKYPDLAKEWHPTKNGLIKPEMVYSQSNKNVWWLGKCGHEWQTSPNNRINGKDCPICSGQKVLSGFNDLATVHPELIKEWNYEKNEGLKNKNGDDISTPNKVSAHSGQKVWWRCSNGHEWIYTISDRASGDGCPYCSGRKAIEGETDLATNYPDIAKEWDSIKNGNLKPTDIKPNYSKAVWWRCDKGHEWKTSPNNRVNGNTGCPKCFRLRVGKRVMNVDTGEIYDNSRLAAEACGLKSFSGISQCCRGERNMSGGYHWEFVD